MKNNPAHLTEISIGKSILSEFDLCDFCLGRLVGSNKISSSKILGKKIRKKLGKNFSKCYLCKNLLDNLDKYVDKSLESSSTYKFESFQFGAIIKPSISERDDQLRSKFRLRGVDSVKTAITKNLSKKFSKRTKTEIDFLQPDVTITVNFKEDYVEIRAKSIIIFGRYNKSSRNMPQKQKPCPSCLGKGCFQCSFHGLSGYDSVEGQISKYFFSKFGCKQVKISWIGGEDKSSLVLGNGRPFFIKLIEPHIRKIRFPKKVSLEGVDLSKLKIVNKIPSKPLRFKTRVKLEINCDSDIEQKMIDSIESLKNTDIKISDNTGKNSKKHIYSVNCKKLSETSLVVSLTADGGLPIKRFVSETDVVPNLEQVLNTKCRCINFDFYGIDIQR